MLAFIRKATCFPPSRYNRDSSARFRLPDDTVRWYTESVWDVSEKNRLERLVPSSKVIVVRARVRILDSRSQEPIREYKPADTLFSKIRSEVMRMNSSINEIDRMCHRRGRQPGSSEIGLPCSSLTRDSISNPRSLERSTLYRRRRRRRRPSRKDSWVNSRGNDSFGPIAVQTRDAFICRFPTTSAGESFLLNWTARWVNPTWTCVLQREGGENTPYRYKFSRVETNECTMRNRTNPLSADLNENTRPLSLRDTACCGN